MITVRQRLENITDDFEAVLREADGPKGGMRVPFMGDWAQAVQLPSLLGVMRRHVRDNRASLAVTDDQKDLEIQALRTALGAARDSFDAIVAFSADRKRFVMEGPRAWALPEQRAQQGAAAVREALLKSYYG